jgi:biotin carboxylase
MRRVLLLLPTTTYQADAFVEAARRLRVAVVVGTDRGQVFGERTHTALTLPFADAEAAARAVVEFARAYPLDAVVATDDATSILAARLARALGLPHNPVEAAEASRNKFARRWILRQAGLPSPEFALVAHAESPVGFPCVLKPLELAASRGVIRADSPAEFAAAYGRITALLKSLGREPRLLVEGFIPGREVALEGVLTDGRLRPLAIFDKPDPLDGPFFEETLYVTPSRLPEPAQRAIVDAASRACAALGLVTGPIHAELRVNDEGPWILEVAARSIGGRCARALRFGAGISLEELILRHAIGMEIESLRREEAASGVMMIPIPRRGVLREVRRKGPQTEITIPLGEEVVPLPEGNRYLGFIFAQGATPSEVEAALRREHGELDLVID